MDIKEIKQIIDLMKRARLAEFEIHEGEFSLRLVRDGDASNAASGVSQPPFPVAPVAAPVAAPAPAAAPAPEPAAPASESPVIKSPMVGTFYVAPAPDSPSFVKVGDEVGPDSVVCILEAMKVMNEITAETSGTIAEVLVQNGMAVEYGQPLFRLK